MKVIIAGSRHIEDDTLVYRAINQSCFDITEVVSGTARGIDTLGEQWAKAHNIPCKRFPPDWDKHGKKAGILRNVEMAEYADALVAVWDGFSRGTAHMIDSMTLLGKPVYQIIV